MCSQVTALMNGIEGPASESIYFQVKKTTAACIIHVDAKSAEHDVRLQITASNKDVAAFKVRVAVDKGNTIVICENAIALNKVITLLLE